jgi:hypothetical protein
VLAVVGCLSLVILPASVGSAFTSGWSLERLPPRSGTTLRSISCTSGIACIVVGDTSVLRWNGVRWVRESTPIPPGTTAPSFSGVSCRSSSSCVAVGTVWNLARNGNEPLAEHWGGSRWSYRIAPSPVGVTIAADGLRAVSCPSRSACTAVGYSVNSRPTDLALVERWDGSRWRLQQFPLKAHSSLLGVACTSNRTCIAVGQHLQTALAARWDGSHWTTQGLPGGTNSRLSAIACTSRQACLAVGHHASRTLAERWDGRRWSVIPTPTVPGTDSDDFFAVSCSSGTACTTVGSAIDLKSGQAEPLAERWEGGRWSIQQPSVNVHAANISRELNGVSCPSPISCTAVGFRFRVDYLPLVEQWNRPIVPVVTG